MNLEILKTKIKLGTSLLWGPVKKFVFQPSQRKGTYYAWYYKHQAIHPRLILYEAFYGRGLLCNPYAIFQELIQHPQYGSYQHVWVLDRLENHQELIQRYQRMYQNVSFVQIESRAYLKYLASAKYLINNFTFPQYFIKKPGQVYVNTWHGIPLKTLGYDEPQGALVAPNTIRNFLHADYLLSANPFLTEIYKNAFKQDGLSEAKIIEEGYPRLDILVNTKKSDIYKELSRAGVSVVPHKKIILYAPTWRGNYGDPDCSLDSMLALKKTLEQRIHTDDYQILVKVHQVVYSKIKELIDDFSYVIPATVDANAVLSITDILISDYSSIYFDYLATGNPVLFYITDLEQYQQQRGLYFGLEELPGPYTDSLSILGTWICNIDHVFLEYQKQYQKVRDWSGNYAIGSISKKIIAAVFQGQTQQIRITTCQTQKKKVLISRGPVQINGISTALINLLNQFDYEHYDVTVLVKSPADVQQREQIMRLNPKARVLVRQGGMILGLAEQIRNNFYIRTNPVKGIHGLFFSKKAYQRECRRIVGNSVFDYAIDYDGYDIFFATLCMMQKDAKSIIWLHNDMFSEYQRRFHWLERVFALYHKFDSLVSCSEQIMEVNRNNLAHYASKEKFRYAKNCVDFLQVHRGSKAGKIIYKQDTYYYAMMDDKNPMTTIRMIPLQKERFDASMDGHITLRDNHEKVKNGVLRFVNVARLSPEKNQAELIRAFARFLQDCPDAMLYLVGQGPEHEKLQNLIRKLNLDGNVILTGILTNPFGLLHQCDCFILPSLHEGQPLTIFEARILHMPIILSDFSSVGGVVIEKGQYMVHKTADSIYEGFMAFLAGKVPDQYVFCEEAYNREAYAQFECAVFKEK